MKCMSYDRRRMLLKLNASIYTDTDTDTPTPWCRSFSHCHYPDVAASSGILPLFVVVFLLDLLASAARQEQRGWTDGRSIPHDVHLILNRPADASPQV